MSEFCACGHNPPGEPNYDCERCMMIVAFESITSNYRDQLQDEADLDERCREHAARVLPYRDVYGDSEYVPPLDDIVESLTRRMEPAVDGYFLGLDNSDPPQLWVWRGDGDAAEPWHRVVRGDER